MLTVVDIFCGAGGLSAGFSEAKNQRGERLFEVAYGVDKDPHSIGTFRANILRDLSETQRERRAPQRSVVGLDGDAIRAAADVSSVDIVIGGPNCQAVSTAGLRNAADERNDMFGHFLSLVADLQPRWFVMENVPGLTHAPNLPILADVFDRLGTLHGYKVAGDVLLAADYGVSQYRYRLIVVGTRTESEVRFPHPTHFADREPRHMTVADVLPRPTDTARPTAATDDLNIRRIAHVPEGGDWRDIPVALLPPRAFSVRSSDQKGAYGRLRWDRPAFTITGLASNVTAGPFTHPSLNRAITASEAATLQGFPAGYRFGGPPAARYRQIGNAVPPPLARAIAECIAALDAGEDVGRPGRLTPEVVAAAVASGKGLPVMTPRIDKAKSARSTKTATARPSVVPNERDAAKRLEVEAKLPSFMWTAKRARAILGAQNGQEVATLAEDLRVSEHTVRRWVDRFAAFGSEGWRAYHTPPTTVAGHDAVLARKLEAAVRAVRRAELGSGTERPSMTPRLLDLVARFQTRSVNDLRRELQERGLHVGTSYVGDLLAMAGVVVPVGDEQTGQAASTA